MSNAYPATPGSPNEGSSGGSGKVDAAKEQAADVGAGAKEATKQVAGTAKDEAGKVVSEAKGQAKQLIGQTRSELTEQATTQQARVASGLKSLSEELTGMADGTESKGVASDVVGMAAERVGDIAAWLDARDPGSLLDEVKQFAARRPGTFIAAAAVAGLLVGRLTRSVAGAVSDKKEEAEATASYDSTSYDASSGATGYDATGYVAPLPPVISTSGTVGGTGLGVDGVESRL